MESALIGLILGFFFMVAGFAFSGRDQFGGWAMIIGAGMALGGVIELVSWWLA